MLRYFNGFDEDFFTQFDRLRRQMDEVFGNWPSTNGIRSVASGSFPAVNIGTSPEQVDVYLFAAGLDPSSLDIQLQQNLLTIAGERKTELPEGADYYRRERFNGSFRRAITLPDDVDQDRVEAKYRDGVLHITVQRRESARPRQIEVK
jgi:HSP20 family protein